MDIFTLDHFIINMIITNIINRVTNIIIIYINLHNNNNNNNYYYYYYYYYYINKTSRVTVIVSFIEESRGQNPPSA
jgi:hypothetical protein